MSQAKQLISATKVAGLGTLEQGGSPLVTLVNVARGEGATMLMLLSGLAKHSKNLADDPRASLLLAETAATNSDPMTLARVSLTGRAFALDRESDASARQLFLERHPSAAVYAEFEDFSLYQFDIEGAHLVAGFGRIASIPVDQLS